MWSQTYTRPAGNITIDFSQNNLSATAYSACSRKRQGFGWALAQPLETYCGLQQTQKLITTCTVSTGGMRQTACSTAVTQTARRSDIRIQRYNWSTNLRHFIRFYGIRRLLDKHPSAVKAIAAGNVYWGQTEHSPGPNLEPVEYLGDINATTGASIWNITIVGPGITDCRRLSSGLNNYDNQLYSFGMGPTATTVQTPLTGIYEGQSLAIQGTVLDISSGTKQDTVAKQFPQGVAAVSDASMTAYMEYVYSKTQFHQHNRCASSNNPH